MVILDTPTMSPGSTQATNEEPINLFKLGMLFVIRCRYWSCRAGNDADDLQLSRERIDAKAIASFGTKDLLDPARTRQVFQKIEKKARHALEKHSRPFAAANAHFVPWNHVQTVIGQLESLRTEFDEAVQRFIATYPSLCGEWRTEHPEIPDSCYPSQVMLPEKFSLCWHAFKVAGAPELSPVEDIEMELDRRQARDEQVALMEAGLKRECRQFVEQYVLGFRREVAAFCEQVIEQKGAVHGKTLTAIRDRIDRFHAMNVFGDGDAADKLTRLKQQIAGLTGQHLAEHPDVAARLTQACQTLRTHILAPDAVSQLTGRLKRRVVLE